MKAALILSCVLTIYLAYSIYEPLPDFVQDRTRVRAVGIVWRIFGRFGQIVNLIGTEWRLHSLLNAGLRLLMPTPSNTSSVTFSYKQFGDSRTLVATPADAGKRSGAAVVFIHGGGYITGAPELYVGPFKTMVETLGVDVFAVRYRLAPENPFPAAFDDCLAAVESIFEQAESLGLDRSRIAIAGDSAGGLLTAAVVQHLRVRGSRHRPKAQILLYPGTQFANFRTRSMIENANAPFLKSAGRPRTSSFYLLGDWSMAASFATNGHVTPKVQAAYRAAVGEEIPVEADEETRRRQGAAVESIVLDYRASPLLNPSLDKLELPPTLVVACEFDPLRDDALMYAKRLHRAGAKVELKKYKTYHGVFDMPQDGQPVREGVLDFLKRSL